MKNIPWPWHGIYGCVWCWVPALVPEPLRRDACERWQWMRGERCGRKITDCRVFGALSQINYEICNVVALPSKVQSLYKLNNLLMAI